MLCSSSFLNKPVDNFIIQKRSLLQTFLLKKKSRLKSAVLINGSKNRLGIPGILASNVLLGYQPNHFGFKLQIQWILVHLNRGYSLNFLQISIISAYALQSQSIGDCSVEQKFTSDSLSIKNLRAARCKLKQLLWRKLLRLHLTGALHNANHYALLEDVNVHAFSGVHWG